MAHERGFSPRNPITASAEPSAVRPAGLRDAGILSHGVSSHPAVSVDGERPAVRGWQDKAVLTDGSEASVQPGPDTIVARAAVVDSAGVRSQKQSAATERLVKGAVWMRPGVKLTLRELAKQAKLSFSATCAEGLEVYARAKIRDQEETLFEPRMQAMLRREIRASDNRHVPFEIKNAIAAEQTRILTADLYNRHLQKEGVPLKKIQEKLDDAYKLARSNVLNTKTPKFKNLLAEWWQTTEDHVEGRQVENTGTGKAGTGKPKA
jgi:hypothetical protein